jgi:hypothetical protein
MFGGSYALGITSTFVLNSFQGISSNSISTCLIFKKWDAIPFLSFLKI